MTIQETARQAAHDTHQREFWREDPEVTTIDLVADAVAVAVLREVRAHTNPRTGQVSGFWIDHRLAEFSGDQPRPETAVAMPATEWGCVRGCQDSCLPSRKWCEPCKDKFLVSRIPSVAPPAQEPHQFKEFGLNDPRYYAGICATCGDIHKPAPGQAPETPGCSCGAEAIGGIHKSGCAIYTPAETPPDPSAVAPLSSERTLKDYRPQHDVDCEAIYCGVCHYAIGYHLGDPDFSHVFVAKPCTCGLDALLTALSGAGETKTEEISRATGQPQLRALEADPRGDQGGRS